MVAAIPAAVWLYFLFNKGESNKKTVALIFGLGCLTAPALLGLQYFWTEFPRFNLDVFIQENIHTQSTQFIATFVLFGALEEIIKHYVVTATDRKTVLVKTIGDSIKYSLAAALGFAFTENIYYLYQFWPSISLGELTGMYIFRSGFTTCAHLIFSGIFGYFYGIGKFSIQITKQQKLLNQQSRITKAIANIFNLPLSHAYQQQMVVKGLFIAIVLHAGYNYLLQLSILPPVIILVVLGYLYLRYLLSRKAGHLILETDITKKKKATIAKKDKEVVVELLGMWFKDKRYVDVIHIAERLLERDPDNKVVKMFKAKAMDKIDDNDTYKSILGNMFKSNLDEKSKNVITSHIEEKEELTKNRGEQRPSKEKKKKKSKKQEDSKKFLEDLQKGDSFKLG